MKLLAADLILVVHALFVCFIVFGLLAVLLGGALGWHWVRNPWFRLAHLGGIAFVVVQSWLGQICPLTIWESNLRQQAGAEGYSGSFIQHWLHAILFYSAPQWVFVVVYTVFGVLVLASWYWVRPRWPQA